MANTDIIPLPELFDASLQELQAELADPLPPIPDRRPYRVRDLRETLSSRLPYAQVIAAAQLVRGEVALRLQPILDKHRQHRRHLRRIYLWRRFKPVVLSLVTLLFFAALSWLMWEYQDPIRRFIQGLAKSASSTFGTQIPGSTP